MSRKFGAFNPASTATTVIVVSSPDYNAARFLISNAPSTSSSVKYYHSFESTLTTIQFGGGTVSSNAGAAITTNATAVKIGTQSLDFPGNDPVTIVPASAGDFSLTSAYTLELFFRREATGGVWSTMLGSTNANSVGWPFLSTRYGKLSAKDKLIGSTSISNNVWYHGALVRYSDGSGALFLNGVKDATTSSLAEFVTDNFVLGAINVADSGDGYWNGQLDEIRFTREALYSTTFTVPTKALFVPGTDDLSGEVTVTTSSNIRSHSHVWNYSDVYKGNRADTWPDNDLLFEGVTASGATVLEPGNGFKYFVYTTSGALTVPSASAGVNVEYLVVAGGGGGGADRAGAAGAGGLRTNVSGNPLAGSSMTLPAATYPVTVGAGGLAGFAPQTPSPLQGGGPSYNGAVGSNSVFNGITSAGGGGGQGSTPTGGNRDGGSGAGGATNPGGPLSGGSGNTPSVTPPQGNDGANGVAITLGGGGGGAGAAASGGNGGNGHPIPAFAAPLISPAIPSDAATAIGSTGLYAGGGGGGAGEGTPSGAGSAGTGGGGAGGARSIDPSSSNPNSGAPGPAGAAGVENTGGGGGGAGNFPGTNANMRPGGDGGKGIVILRMPTSE